MANIDEVRRKFPTHRKFPNHREWREFIAAVHESVTYPCSVTYPVVLSALRSGRAGFYDGAARATNWLSSRTEVDGQSLGI